MEGAGRDVRWIIRLLPGGQMASELPQSVAHGQRVVIVDMARCSVAAFPAGAI